jgi:hypothetical protein
MARITLLLPLLLWPAVAAQPERLIESVLPSLAYGPSCWSSLDLRNLGDRVVSVEVESHRASGALVPLVGHPAMSVRLTAGERASFRVEIQEETGEAWVKVRERIPSPLLFPIVAIAGTTECVADNKLQTTGRELAFPTRNPWFSGDIDQMRGNVISLVNTSERAAKASLCYSEGNLYSLPSQIQPIPQLTPICSHAFEVQIPPFGARQFPLERQGATHFSMKTEGESIVLQMLRPMATGVKIYSVDSTIKFGGEITTR